MNKMTETIYILHNNEDRGPLRVVGANILKQNCKQDGIEVEDFDDFINIVTKKSGRLRVKGMQTGRR